MAWAEPAGCLCGIWAWLSPSARVYREEAARAKFEQTVLFLKSVPLFRHQLPPSELPKVAALLKEREWKPGCVLLKQGKMGKSFFLIFSGEADLFVRDDEGSHHLQTTLCAGDWIGGRSLIVNRPSVATVIARGPQRLVTLSMTKRDLRESGLTLQFPKRPAIYLGRESSYSNVPCCPSPLTAAEREIVARSVCKNVNLRALCDSSGTSALEATIALLAVRREVPAGSTIAKSGDLGKDFFVVADGAVDVIVEDLAVDSHVRIARSAEKAVSTGWLAERIRRKRHFMLDLQKKSTQSPARWTRSVIASVRRHSPRGNTRFNSSSWAAEKKLSWKGSGKPVLAWLKQAPIHSYYSEGDQGVPERAMSSTSWIPGLKNVDLDDMPTKQDGRIAQLYVGDSFGELSLMYNTRREATYRAAEDTVLYVVSRRDFKHLLRPHGHRLDEYTTLLDEVTVLQPLLHSERRELASCALDLVYFEAGQRVLTQGQVRRDVMWYVIASGSAVFSHELEGRNVVVSEIGRGGYFGERSLLKCAGLDECAPEVSIDAGPTGMSCLIFDGEMMRDIFRGIQLLGSSPHLNLECHIDAYEAIKQTNTARCSMEFSQLQEVCVLGRGGFGCVFLVRHGTQRYALKRVSKGLTVKLEATEHLRWERDLLMMLDTPFITHLHRTYKDDQYIYFLLEAALGGDLYKLSQCHPEVFTADRPRGYATAFYAACIIAGLEHLHERRIAFRDLKPENVMLDEQGYGKIIDMGLARFVVGKTYTQCGTPDYMPPEVIDPPHAHSLSCDWWALGVVVYELLCGQPPFDDDGLDAPLERLMAIRRSQEINELTFPFSCPVLGKSFVQALLQKLPHRLGAKFGAASVRKHNFFCSHLFDFDALHLQKLPSPWHNEWQDPSCPELGNLHGESDPQDDLFVRYSHVEGQKDWTAGF